MDGITIETSEKNIWQVKSQAKTFEHTLEILAGNHSQILPQSPSSRSGVVVLKQMYELMAEDDNACVLTAPKVSGFASGTTNLRASEKSITKKLKFKFKIRLIFFNLLAPGHLLAMISWQKRIPAGDIGYVLSIGLDKKLAQKEKTFGSHLLKELEHFFSQKKCLESWVDTENSNIKAINFYIRCGYEVVDRSFGHCLLKKELKL